MALPSHNIQPFKKIAKYKSLMRFWKPSMLKTLCFFARYTPLKCGLSLNISFYLYLKFCIIFCCITSWDYWRDNISFLLVVLYIIKQSFCDRQTLLTPQLKLKLVPLYKLIQFWLAVHCFLRNLIPLYCWVITINP